MSEKQVSVRLVARGGQQVRAELERIGTTGAAALGRIEPAAASASRAMTRVSDVARASGFRMRNLSFQLNDVFVSLASGMNPMMVFIQQGSQIAQIYAGEGGVTNALRDVGTMARWVVTRLGPVAAVVGAAAAAVSGMGAEIKRTSGEAVTFGDTARAVWQVVRDGVWNLIRPAALQLGEWFAFGWRAVVDATRIAGNAMVRGVQIAVAGIRTVWDGGWKSLYGTALVAVDDTILALATFGDRAAAIFTGAYDAALVVWKRLPQALGDFAFSAANTLIAGVEAMLNGIVERINSFIRMLNDVLSNLPEWATGESGLRIGEVGNVALGRVENPYANQAAATGAAAQGAFDAALARTYLQPPQTGLRGRGNEALAGGAAAWADFQAEVREIMASDPLGQFFDEVKVRAIENALARAGEAAKATGSALARVPKEALEGFDAIISKLDQYATQARDMAGSLGDALVGAFRSAEDAIGEFVRTGKLEFGSLVTSILADMAKIAARRFILGPLAQGVGNLLGGGVGAALAKVLHSGGVVGMAGTPRAVPALAFAGAPRMHNGGWVGLRPDEVPAILQKGERVLARREARAWASGASGGVTVNIMARDAESFRASRTQIAIDLLGNALLGAFRTAEDAIAEFVQTGKLEFGSLVKSSLAHMERIADRRFIVGPLAHGIGNVLGSGVGAATAKVLHSGGVVGMAGTPRAVPALAFAGAPRMHNGGWVGLRPDEVPAILQKGERVLARREARAWASGASGGVTVNIMARDAESFRASRTQIAADIARAVSAGRRGM